MNRPSSADPGVITALREALDRQQFAPEPIRAALGTEEDIFSRQRDIPIHLRRLRTRGAFGSLVQLFVLNEPTDAALVAEGVAPVTLEACQRMGVLKVADGTVRALIRIVPHDDLLIASDLRLEPGEEAPHDHVPGVHRPSVTLAALTVRARVERGLDLGTGNGVEALIMARHTDHVVGSDVNARAIEFARFNGHLNRVSGIDWRVGSWFEPMQDDQFDVIACNPPYVISPSTQYIYRDSGMKGDSVSEQVTREVAAHLREGGFGTVTVSWAAPRGDEDATPVRRWVADTGCDAWILHYSTHDPLTTAKTWLQTDAIDPLAYASEIDTWLAYYDSLGIETISYGALVLHKRSAARNWVRLDPLPAARLMPASDHIRRVFEANDLLQRVDDEKLMSLRFRVPATVRITRTTSSAGPVGEPHLSLSEGVGFEADVDENVANILMRLRDTRLREAVAAAATAGGIAAADRAQFMSKAPTLARRLYAMGFIEVSDRTSG